MPVVRSMKTQKPLDRKKPHPIAAWIGLLVLAILGGVALFYSARKSLSPLPEKSIAVLPFLDLSPEKDQEYFCDGMTEELISQLARIDGLRVVARTSAFQFKGKPQDVRQVGKQLNVTTVLEGSVRKAGGHLRITAQLIGVSDGYHLWSESYDRDLRGRLRHSEGDFQIHRRCVAGESRQVGASGERYVEPGSVQSLPAWTLSLEQADRIGFGGCRPRFRSCRSVGSRLRPSLRGFGRLLPATWHLGVQGSPANDA